MAFLKKLSGQNYLGIDIGASGIKIVECKNDKGKPRLINYGFSVEPLETIGEKDLRNNPLECASVVQQILLKAKMASKKAIASLPTFSVFSSVITISDADKKVIAEEVRERAKRIIPLPIEDMVLDWKVLSSIAPVQEKPKPTNLPEKAEVITEKRVTTVRILLTAAQRKLVSSYVQIFKLAKLELLSLETEAFALIRSLIGNEQTTIMTVDIGAVSTDLSIIRNVTPILNRSLNIGGINLTKTLAETLSVNLSHAEEIKKDLGLSLKNERSLAFEKIKEMLGPILHEIRYTANLYGGPIEKIILTGGSAFLPSLPQYFENVLNIRVILGNPWSRTIYPKGLEPVLQEIGPRFSVAAGLAMREIL